jgi:ATP-dependent helicase/nuclease subunit A
LRGFVQWIDTLRRNELYDAESTVPDSDEDAVRLMTVHGSKGLEFPIVILSGLGGGARPSDGVQLLPDRYSGRLEARITARIGEAFHTANFDGEREKRLAQAEGLRLLYVAATRAREHLVLCLFHSPKYGKATHAAEICQRLPELGDTRPVEIPLVELQSQGSILSDLQDASAVALSPEEHEATEAAWIEQRSALLAALASERHATPSGLAHETVVDADKDGGEANDADPPAVTDDEIVSLTRSRPPRAATTLGLAVHAVLQWVDLETLADLDDLASWSSTAIGLDSSVVSDIAILARRAAESAPVREAVASARYWREVPLSVVLDGVLIDGTIDLLYETSDGALVVVDYKTDRVSGKALADRAASYHRQGQTYADAIARATGRAVSRVCFVFAGGSPDGAVTITERQFQPTSNDP